MDTNDKPLPDGGGWPNVSTSNPTLQGQSIANTSQPVRTPSSQNAGFGQKSGIWTTISSVAATSTGIKQEGGSAPESDLVARLSSPVLSGNTQPSHSVLPDSGHTYAMAVTTSASPSGSTIHHLSQSSLRQMSSQPNKVTSVTVGGTITKSANTPSVIDSAVVSSVTYSRPNTSPISSPKPKRLKGEEKLLPPEEVASIRKCILDYKMKHFIRNKENYHEHACELFFLQNGGNMMDYGVWKKRPTPQLLSFLRDNKVDSDEDDDQSCSHPEVAVPSAGGTPIAVSTTLPAAVTLLTQGGTPLVPDTSSTNSAPIASAANQANRLTHDAKLTSSTSSPTKSPKLFPPSPASTTVPQLSKVLAKQQSLSTAYNSSIGSQEQIVERAKQEAYVMQRVSELRKEGLWSTKRLPKVQEPPRVKAHWDYLLEEMVWLATDFAQERKWKKAAARKCARMVVKHLQERKLKEERAEKEEGLKLRRIASFIAKEVKQFWANIEKVAEYKQQSILDEKRKKALDLHLNFIVDQTEKYSSWLTQGLSQNLNKTNSDEPASALTSSCHSRTSSPTNTTGQSNISDDEFNPESETDDEETISKAEIAVDENEQNEEIAMLQKESELPIEDILKDLPQEILDKPASIHSNDDDDDADNEEVEEQQVEKETGDDNDFKADVQSSDDEATLDEQELNENNVNHQQELNDLQDEGNLSIEELYKKYAAAYDSDFEMPKSDNETVDSDDDDDSDDDANQSEQEESADESEHSDDENVQDMGVEFLLDSNNQTDSQQDGDKSSGPSKEISDIAAAAQSFQPKGYTLSTAQVCTKVPFLLKHTLREYQHIGLDWLVAMNDKKLNGILADEMGLGKTIQTIALLAHLACEKGNWGPHLIVVPTSVMLNWEMELKKWCPAFKIITYYGSVKERKKKREGWTKPNTFHVCITSYKLVVQDHHSFRRKKWKYLILDEAQNIKNFKSQRWQYLLNLATQRRLLLTGTPLQNSLMELWSLMHFLMPNVFSSHKEFKEWFANPMSDMIDGSHDYNDSLIKRLHKVLRPFLLRRLKCEVEKQLPLKYEHVVMCRLSKRQRFLYEDFMSRTKTKETLESGNFLSVINVLMQLRKVCNHPNLFEERPFVSPFQMEGISYQTASIVLKALEYDPLKHINLWTLNLLLTNLELTLTAFAAHRIRKFQRSQKLIEEIDSQPEPAPKCPPGKIRLHIRSAQPSANSNAGKMSPHPSSLQTSKISTPLGVRNPISGTQNVRSVISQAAAGMSSPAMTVNSSNGPITVQIQQTQQGPRLTLPAGQINQLPGFAQLVQTSTGQHILLTTSATAAQLLQQAQAQIQQQQVPTSQTNHSTSALSTQPSSSTQSSLLTNSMSSSPSLTTAVSSSGTSLVKPTTVTTTKPVVKVAPFHVNAPANLNSGSVNRPTTTTTAETDPKATAPSPPVQDTTPVSQSEIDPSIFDHSAMLDKFKQIRKDRLSVLGRINKRRCEACPLYGSDLIQAVNIQNDTNPVKLIKSSMSWKGMGYVHCLNASKSYDDSRRYANYTCALAEIVNTPEMALNKLKTVVDRYVFNVPAARAPTIKLHVSHPPPSLVSNDRRMHAELTNALSPKTAFLHPISSLMHTQFPDRRLIQYDCGKLQILDRLLRDLKSGHHRVLIFTQMTRMLDVLEAFLNIHGHIYLRLDGATKVDQRQALMERFNADKRIFVFILSTRSGGIGVNLTGADTVIFYDSDWNPTMDAQAQDRCHRIGQTRDVHIYRLISEKTIEENILKKANQKRLLGNIAIEGGNFTTAFFQQNALTDLFGDKAKEAVKAEAAKAANDKCSQMQLEQALCQAEEESDVTAAKTAKAEAAAELAEFDESIPFDDSKQDEPSQVQEEIGQLMEQLSPVERYALHFLESIQQPVSMELIKQAEEEIEAQKNNWELGRLQALKEEEERRAEMEEESLPYYTYSREESQVQVPKRSKSDRKSKTGSTPVRKLVENERVDTDDSCSSSNETKPNCNKDDEPSRRSSRISIKGRRSYIEMISDCLTRKPRDLINNNHTIKEPGFTPKSIKPSLHSPALSSPGSASPDRDPAVGGGAVTVNGIKDESLSNGRHNAKSLTDGHSPNR